MLSSKKKKKCWSAEKRYLCDGLMAGIDLTCQEMKQNGVKITFRNYVLDLLHFLSEPKIFSNFL